MIFRFTPDDVKTPSRQRTFQVPHQNPALVPQVSEGEEFLSLTAGQLVALVKRDELNVRCESEVFNAVLRWVKHDEGRRRSKMADVLYAVRCHFLTPRFLKQQLQTCDLVRSMPQCCDYLSRIIQVSLSLHCLFNAACYTS